jgi:predicted DNA-binding protein with PD1-like motif
VLGACDVDFTSLNIRQLLILRIEPGEAILPKVREFIQKSGLRQAIVVAGYGTMAKHHLHWVQDNKIPTANIFGEGEGGIEILSMNGTVVSGEPHIHVTLSTVDGAYGGHLEDGCIAYVICEIFFLELVGKQLHRESVKVNVPGMGEGFVSRLKWS